MSKAKDLTGETIGRLTVIRRDGRIGRHIAWLCRCKCGCEKRIKARYLNSRASRSCGCLRRKSLTPGDRFGRYVVMRMSERETGARQEMFWVCRCDCGNEREVLGGNLRSGNSKSCGCMAREKNSKHGMHGSEEYGIWAGMLRRCYTIKNPKYDSYGGRGIIVCDRWRGSFSNFYSDMGPRPSPEHSIDRIDNDGNYDPSNCKWSTQKEQMNNRRNTVRMTVDGDTLTVAEWASLSGIRYETLMSRRRRGWTDVECVKGRK